MINRRLEGYSRCEEAKNQLLDFTKILTIIHYQRLNKEIYEFLQFWENKSTFIELLSEFIISEVLNIKPYDVKKVNGRLNVINEMLKNVRFLNVNSVLSEDETSAVFLSIFNDDALRAFTRYGRREPFKPSWTSSWGNECKFGRGCQSFAKKIALTGKKRIEDFNTFMINPSPGSRDSRVVIVLSYGMLADDDNELELCGSAIIIPFRKVARIISSLMNR